VLYSQVGGTGFLPGGRFRDGCGRKQVDVECMSLSRSPLSEARKDAAPEKDRLKGINKTEVLA
jgi:hypothetical protein